METIRVALGSRAYPIHIGSGLLDDTRLYAPHVGGRSIAVVSNTVVAPLYLERVTRALAAAGARNTLPVVVEDGEQAKSWQTLERVFDQLLAARLGRDAILVALGGGVIGDLEPFQLTQAQQDASDADGDGNADHSLFELSRLVCDDMSDHAADPAPPGSSSQDATMPDASLHGMLRVGNDASLDHMRNLGLEDGPDGAADSPGLIAEPSVVEPIEVRLRQRRSDP